ncbi:nuclear pore complex protein NUP35-like [Hordeum vulgare subsp. vulgare]|uniref:RRM Nup35-type domain-containing protein n=1 Tax=Hordeum vulgare subsp. vulgare TaxID=112509 RepID=A0A8I6WTD9_HORVV|nr:nuclear pore complex protein NUP35-like [Hordeum vulgare subsp. vulgare]
MASPSPFPPRRTPTTGGRQSPFFRDLARAIPSHRISGSLDPSSTPPPPPPLFTLDDRFHAQDFSPDRTASNLLPVAPSPSPPTRASSAGRPPSWDPSRAIPPGPCSLSDWIVEPARNEALALPPPSSPPANADARSPVVPLPAPPRTAPSASVTGVDAEEWVTVFGFSGRETNLVLREFGKCGVILRHCSGPRDGNWIHILYQHQYDALRALEKNGIQLFSGVAVGVKITDPVQLQMDEKMSGSNYKGFMVSLPSKSSIQNARASSNLGNLPRPYDPKAGRNGNRDMGCSTGSVAMPAKSVLAKTMDLIFGI